MSLILWEILALRPANRLSTSFQTRKSSSPPRKPPREPEFPENGPGPGFGPKNPIFGLRRPFLALFWGFFGFSHTTPIIPERVQNGRSIGVVWDFLEIDPNPLRPDFPIQRRSPESGTGVPEWSALYGTKNSGMAGGRRITQYLVRLFWLVENFEFLKIF